MECADAAWSGHLELLKWARLNGCPWNEFTCSRAAFNGHLGLLKWARLNGCPWNEEEILGIDIRSVILTKVQ